MNIDLSKIRFILNGEQTDAEVINRPSKDLIKEIDKVFNSLSLGGTATLVEDFDSIDGNGFFTNGENTVDAHSPENLPNIGVIHVEVDSQTATQIGFEDKIDGRTFKRSKTEGIWSLWSFFYSSVHNYGLGSTNNILLGNAKAVRGSSFEYQHPSAPNKVGASDGALINAQPSTDYAIQIAYVGDGKVIASGKYDGVWGDDLELLHSGNSVNPIEFGLGTSPYSVSNWNAVVGGSFASADNANNNPTINGFDVNSLMTSTYTDPTGKYKGIFGISKNEPRSFGRSSGNLDTVGWNKEWFEHYTTFNQNVPVNTNLTAKTGFGYYLRNNSTITLDASPSIGDSIRFRRSLSALPRIKAPSGVDIIIRRKNGDNVIDNEIIFDINSEIIMTFNGTAWEV